MDPDPVPPCSGLCISHSATSQRNYPAMMSGSSSSSRVIKGFCMIIPREHGRCKIFLRRRYGPGSTSRNAMDVVLPLLLNVLPCVVECTTIENSLTDANNHILKTPCLERLANRERQKRSWREGHPNHSNRDMYQTLSRHDEGCDLQFRYQGL